MIPPTAATFIVVALVALAAVAEAAPTLKTQRAMQSGSHLKPLRVEMLRTCGPPANATSGNNIEGFVCNTAMQRVALACLDTHMRYICDAGIWRFVVTKR